MTRNATTLEINSQTPDWVEVTNASGAAVNLAGYRLTNKANATARYTFPDVTLENGESTVVYLTDTEIDLGEEYAAQSADFKAPPRGKCSTSMTRTRTSWTRSACPRWQTGRLLRPGRGAHQFFLL